MPGARRLTSVSWTPTARSPGRSSAILPYTLDTLGTGIYAAWAQVADGEDRAVYKAAVSVEVVEPVRGGVASLASLKAFGAARTRTLRSLTQALRRPRAQDRRTREGGNDGGGQGEESAFTRWWWSGSGRIWGMHGVWRRWTLWRMEDFVEGTGRRRRGRRRR